MVAVISSSGQTKLLPALLANTRRAQRQPEAITVLRLQMITVKRDNPLCCRHTDPQVLGAGAGVDVARTGNQEMTVKMVVEWDL